MYHEAEGALARDELGISETLRARPLQAAVASAAFSIGAAVPSLTATLSACRQKQMGWMAPAHGI